MPDLEKSCFNSQLPGNFPCNNPVQGMCRKTCIVHLSSRHLSGVSSLEYELFGPELDLVIHQLGLLSS